MIIGIGTDIVQIPRIEHIVNKYGILFQTRILSLKELEQFNQLPESKKMRYLAKRFAAKEAVSKALGTGIADGLKFRDIGIYNDEAGKPYVEINPLMVELINRNRQKNGQSREAKGISVANLVIHLSISDDYPVAVAFAVIYTSFLDSN